MTDGGPRQWFRLYREVIHDPKLRKATPAQRWLWVALLCLADDDGLVRLAPGVPYDDADLADLAGVEVADVECGLEHFRRLGMVESAPGGLVVVKWNSRQFKADSSTDRVRAFRQRQIETPVKRDETVSVTPPEQSRAETEQSRERQERTAAKAAAPPSADKPSFFRKPTLAEVTAYCREHGYTFDPAHFLAYYKSNGWRVGRQPMRDWHAACVTWQSRERPAVATRRRGTRVPDAPTHADDDRATAAGLCSRCGGPNPLRWAVCPDCCREGATPEELARVDADVAAAVAAGANPPDRTTTVTPHGGDDATHAA